MDEFEAAFTEPAPVAEAAGGENPNPFGEVDGGDFGGAPPAPAAMASEPHLGEDDMFGAPADAAPPPTAAQGGDDFAQGGGDFSAGGGDFSASGDFAQGGGDFSASGDFAQGGGDFSASGDFAQGGGDFAAGADFAQGSNFAAPMGNGGELMGNGVEALGGLDEAHLLAPESAPPPAMLDDFGAAAEAPGSNANHYMFSEPSSAQEVWAKEQYEILQQKEAEEAVAKAELKRKAAAQKEELYAMREKEMEAKRKVNREAEQLTEYTPSSGSLWENVHGLVDLTSKASDGKTDLTRMRQLFVKLKHGAGQQ